LATGVTPLGGSFAALAAARDALGLGEGLNMPSISSLVARWFPLEERTRATVVNLTGIHTGTLVALPLSGWIAATWGWRPIFYIYALVGLVWVALWFLWAPEPPLTGAEPARVVRVPWALLLRRHVPVGYAAVACLSGALACFALAASTVLVNSLDLSPRHAGVLVGLQGTAGNVAGMVSPVLGGAIVARTGDWNLNFYLIA